MKKILLQTMPHTGTHCMHYLFAVLGGIEVIWHHWEKSCLEDIKILKGIDWDDFVFVRTYRNPVATLESYKGRAADEATGEAYYSECVNVCAQNMLQFPVPIAIEIDGDIATKTRNALEVFRRCGVVPPEEALEYMKTWEKIGSQHNMKLPSKAIKQSIHKGRVSTWHTN